MSELNGAPVITPFPVNPCQRHIDLWIEQPLFADSLKQQPAATLIVKAGFAVRVFGVGKLNVGQSETTLANDLRSIVNAVDGHQICNRARRGLRHWLLLPMDANAVMRKRKVRDVGGRLGHVAGNTIVCRILLKP